ncbi:alcohol dehydrogenase catalytic domain-containing protein [uncultured Cellulomonas sp.]|uniref:alcohol dehydrogenase catalytic domain-containing protein n=1 Tax=uncultured Cellulomonas sp. TaxID=189682 RepID=UPI00261FF9AB|nr:alcohol dehydrogenase catalytic domain-containing protein [uncultured Cellulomonas sp.]
MRAVVVDEFGALPSLRDAPVPACLADGVVVRVEATGVCRSDWHGWQGHDDGITLPHVPGHELAGTVAAVGADVSTWTVGDRVTVPFVCACGTCEACRAGEHQVCERQTQPGFTHDGSFAEYVALDHADVNLVRLPQGLSPVTAAALGCRFATAYRAVTVHGRPRPGDWVAVHGCGGVGLSAVMVAVAAGARVVALDTSAAARAAAAACGADVVLDPAEGTTTGGVVDPAAVAARVVATTGGGAHVSLDALGSPATAVASVLGLRRRGRHVQVGLLLATAAHPPLPMDRVVAWELEIIGSHGMAAHEYPAMLARIASGELRPDRLVGRTIGLPDAPAALAAMSRPAAAAGMTVIVP